MATSDVTICNLALSHIGADAMLASINPPDGSVEAGYCQRYYPVARQELIETGVWAFTKTRVALSALSTNPSTVWQYAYAEPSDMVKPLRVLSLAAWQSWLVETYGAYPSTPFVGWPSTSEVAMFTERGTALYDRENGALLTNEQNAVLLYVRDVVDTSKFTAGFTVALSYLLASYLVGPILKGREGAVSSRSLREIAGQRAREAEATDANASPDSAEFLPSNVRARG